MKRIFVSAPYTHGDVAVNVRRAVEAGNEIIKAGHAPFIPHLFHFAHYLEFQPYNTWTEVDLAWVSVCDFLIRLDGHSPGADGEVAFARELNIPVYFSMRELLGMLKGYGIE